MAKISFVRIVIAAILYTIIAQIVHTIGAFLSMGYYTMEKYFPVWSKIMMTGAGPPPASFYVYSIVFGFIAALFISFVYSVIKTGVPGKNFAHKGIMYGFLLFLVAGIPGMLSLVLLINLPLGLVISWTIQGLVIYLIGGMVIGMVIR